MEPICWAGLVGVIAITAAVVSMLKGSCGCESKKEAPAVKEPTTQAKQSSAPVTGIDDKKEKAINDLIK